MKIVFLDLSTFRRPGEIFDFSPLQNLGNFVTFEETSDSQLEDHAREAEVVILIKNRLGEEQISKLRQAKLICKAGSGYDNIDIAAAKARGIGVCNLPAYGSYMVAQWTWSLLLALAGSLRSYDQAMRQVHDWKAVHYAFPIVELQGKTLGLIGYGEIAKYVATWAQAFGMRVLVHSRFPDNNLEQVDLDTIAEASDYISLHSRLDERTRGMVDAKFLKKMKPTSYLINTARAGVIDENALIDCLKNRKIAGAALDVFWEEPPPPDHPLLKMDNVLLTPHIAWGAHETRQRILLQLGEVIGRYFEGKPLNLVSG